MNQAFEPKTFDTAHHDNKILKVDVLFDNPRLRIKAFDGDARGFAFEPSDAPALALAILEAAGYSEDDRKASNPLYVTEFASAIIKLAEGIENQERATAEAEAQAKLEAEALELMNASRVHHKQPPLERFDELPECARADWLAVARKARELEVKRTEN